MFKAPLKVYLLGFMGSGKTTVGKQVARELKMPFVDLDEYIEQYEGRSVAEIFEQEGEAYFRDAETSSIQELIYTQPAIISTGGGAPVHNNNITLLKNTGTCFYLKASANELSERLFQEKRKRPLIAQSENKKQLEEIIKEKLEERIPFYEQAHYHIETDDLSPEKIAEAITDLLNS